MKSNIEKVAYPTAFLDRLLAQSKAQTARYLPKNQRRVSNAVFNNLIHGDSGNVKANVKRFNKATANTQLEGGMGAMHGANWDPLPIMGDGRLSLGAVQRMSGVGAQYLPNPLTNPIAAAVMDTAALAPGGSVGGGILGAMSGALTDVKRKIRKFNMR